MTATTNGSSSTAAAEKKTRKVRSFDELCEAARKNPDLNATVYDRFTQLHKDGISMGIPAMIDAAIKGMMTLVKESDSEESNVKHAAIFLDSLIKVGDLPDSTADMRSASTLIAAANAAIKIVHGAIGVYNAQHGSTLSIVYTGATDSAAPFVGVTNKKRANPTKNDRSWSEFHKMAIKAGIKSVLIPIGGTKDGRYSVDLAPTVRPDDQADAIILNPVKADRNKNKYLTINAARKCKVMLDVGGVKLERQIIEGSHNCWNQCYMPDGTTIARWYDDQVIATAESGDDDESGDDSADDDSE